jgi:hypothetical protein
VLGGGLGEGRTALQGLDDQVVGDVAREAQVDRGVDQGLHDQEDVSRPCAADRRGHVHEALVLDLEVGPESLQESPGLVALLLGHLRRGVPDGHTVADLGGRVGHAADDLAVAEQAGQDVAVGPGHDRHDQLVGPQVPAQLVPDLGQRLGLDREQDDVGVLRGLEVRGDHRHAVLAGQLLAALGARLAACDLGGVDELAAEQAGDYRLGHYARADGRDAAVRKRRHGGEYRRRSSGARGGFARNIPSRDEIAILGPKGPAAARAGPRQTRAGREGGERPACLVRHQVGRED